ncbi:MAG: FKBP-type peptidyl-prolyl cis-trans isomerase [Verrucomicrobia bacterium]|nr:FKBP-type peptidyl-prolyl cis-trans isomerase [Verrucomicrobiota bacterium]
MKSNSPSTIVRPEQGRRTLATLRAGSRCAALSLCLALLAGAVGAADAPVLQSEKEQISYALGMAYGNSLRKQSIDLEPAAFNLGLNDARSGGKTQLTEGEARSLVTGLQDSLKKKQLAVQAEKLQAENEQAEKNKKDGEAFLAANKSKDGVVALENGLQYKILKAGEGKIPGPDDMVVCHYKGTTLDGKEFDSTYVHGKPATMPIKGVIKGWSEALQLMPTGSKWQLFIPSQLAYGARAAGQSFGPNSTLIFEVELVSIVEEKAKASAQHSAPATTAVAAAAK